MVSKIDTEWGAHLPIAGYWIYNLRPNVIIYYVFLPKKKQSSLSNLKEISAKVPMQNFGKNLGI